MVKIDKIDRNQFEKMENMDFSSPDRVETFEELEKSLLMLCKDNNKILNNPCISNYNQNSLNTFNVNSLSEIIEGFVYYNFSFPGYYQMVEQSIGLYGNPNVNEKQFSMNIEENINYTLCSVVKNSDVANYLKQSDEKLNVLNSKPVETIESQTYSIDKSNDLLKPSTESVIFSIQDQNECSEMPINDKDQTIFIPENTEILLNSPRNKIKICENDYNDKNSSTPVRHSVKYCCLHAEYENESSLLNEGDSHCASSPKSLHAGDDSIRCLYDKDRENRLIVELSNHNSEKQSEKENSTMVTNDGDSIKKTCFSDVLPNKNIFLYEKTKNDSDERHINKNPNQTETVIDNNLNSSLNNEIEQENRAIDEVKIDSTHYVSNETKEVLEIKSDEEQKVNKFQLDLDTNKDDGPSQLRIANISEDESDCLILEISEMDTITEQSETEDEKKSKISLSALKSASLKEKDQPNSQNKMFPAGSSDKHEIIQDGNVAENSIESILKESVPEEWNKEHDKTSNRKLNKRNWRREDPTEKIDIDDPEWEKVKTLTTDEERYSAVKNCWNSDSVPNPHKDLTSHSFRLMRMKKEGYIAQHSINRKRTATGNPVGIIDNKRQKTESVPCTDILDRKIEEEKKLYREKLDFEESTYFKALHKIAFDSQKNRNNVLEEYMQKFMQNVQSPSINLLLYAESVKQWREYNEIFIYKKEKEDKEVARKRHTDAKEKLFNDHQQKIDKLYKAREEILKFNQFYCINQLDPTVVEKSRAEEIKMTEEMYNAFTKMYSPARF
ncbi:putative leucine-rich repeat-containing protein DDB_G0290503 [Centruroides vittatus]|uniref:putative leucine-rich repeat-containing protein DDB_G0290503 n=1 Tax=Centruroides vittatus TaxID=120091 RepID=UPI00350FCE86